MNGPVLKWKLREIGLALMAFGMLAALAPQSPAQAPSLKQSSIEFIGVSATEQDRWALVIAVDRGRGAGLDGAGDEARRLISVLTELYGYRQDQIITLIGGDANFKQILRSLQDLTERIPRTASLLIYLSANGVTGPYGDAYALPRDGNVEEKWTLVPLADIAGLARQIRSTLVLTDNCAIGANLIPEMAEQGSALRSERLSREVQRPVQRIQEQVIQTQPERRRSGEFDVITLCPASERPQILTRSLNLQEDSRRYPDVVQAFLQGIHGRAAGSDRNISTQNMIDFMGRVGLDLNPEVQFTSTVNTTPFLLSPGAESRFDGLRRLAANEAASTADRSGAVSSLSRLAAAPGGVEYRGEVGALLQSLILDPLQPSDVRAAALEGLGTEQLSYEWSAEAAQFVLHSDADPRLRLSALAALSRLNAGASSPAIRAALTNDEAEVREAAIELVAKTRDRLAAPALAELAHADPVLSVRTASIAALPAVQSDPQETAEALIPLLSDRTTFVRVQTMNALASAGAVSSAEPIASILVDADQPVYVRQTAAYSLGKLIAPENRDLIFESLTSVLGRQESRAIREAAVYSLGLAGPGDHEFVLANLVIEPGEDPEIRSAAAKALGTLQSVQAVDPLMSVVRDEQASSRLRIAAIEAIGRIGDPVGAKMLYEALNHEDARIREAAAAAIGNIHVEQDPETVMRLISFLADPEYEVRESAIRSLADLTDQFSFEIMAEHLNDKQSLTRRGIVEVFGRQGIPRSLDLLMRASRDPSFDVRISAYQALARLQGLESERDERRRDVLLAGLVDREPAVRRAALTAVRAVIGRLAFEGELDRAKQLAEQAASRLNVEDEAASWFALFLLDGLGADFPVEISLDARSAIETSGPGWMSVQVEEGDELITTYSNESGREVLVTSFGLTANGDVNIAFIQRWMPPGERSEFAGIAQLMSNGEGSHMITRTFFVPAQEADAGRPELSSPAQLHSFLVRLARMGLLQAADIVTVRVVPPPREAYYQESMKR